MKKIELLSPAGNMASLKAAIEAGCDAIYLGGTLFSARAFAGNFNDEEIIEAIKYCHLYGVKVYVTCNILVYEHEIEKFLEYIDFLYRNNVDAIIMQDMGMLDLVHQTFPDLEIHASTQMHIHNLDGVEMSLKLGCTRVVLARETPIEVVSKIKEKTNIELEIFAHGSLCISYSGQCLFSSLIGNRSGNRGSCVGSCRLPYKIIDEKDHVLSDGDYPLSMKDLNTLEYVGNLIEAGVTSLKIEGRMKSPEYVYMVTKLYREAIDSYYQKGKVLINQDNLLKLQRLFSRGFTKGFLFHEDINNIRNTKRPNHQGVEVGEVIDYRKGFIKIKISDNIGIMDGLRIVLDNEDYGFILNEFYINHKLVKKAVCGDIIEVKVNKLIPLHSKVLLTKDEELIRNIQKRVESKKRKVLVNIDVIAKAHKKLELKASDGKNEVIVEGKVIEESKSKPITSIEIEDKIRRVGDTIYEINDLNILIDNNIFISYKELNDLRRILLNKLDDKRVYQREYRKGKYAVQVNDFPKEQLKSVLVNKVNKNLNYDIIYSENKEDSVIIKLPKVMDSYNDLDINKEYLVGELGSFNKLKNIYTDYSFNVTNSYTVALLHRLGAKRITLSLELTSKQIENIVNAYQERYHAHPNLEIIRSGYREVMTLKTDLNNIYHNQKIYLQDRFHNKYYIREVNGLSYIYEYQKYYNSFNYYDIGINVIRDNQEIEGCL